MATIGDPNVGLRLGNLPGLQFRQGPLGFNSSFGGGAINSALPASTFLQKIAPFATAFGGPISSVIDGIGQFFSNRSSARQAALARKFQERVQAFNEKLALRQQSFAESQFGESTRQFNLQSSQQSPFRQQELSRGALGLSQQRLQGARSLLQGRRI